METIKYKWVRILNGYWDAAFASNNNKPVALPLNGTQFGIDESVGNHMLDAAKG